MSTSQPEPHSGELLRRSHDGDREALAQLVQRHLPGLRAFVRVRMSPLLRAHESESDIVQSTCRELIGKLDGFEYRGEEAFRAWLYTSLLHKLRDKERDLLAQKRDARRRQSLGDAHDSLSECYARALSPSGVLLAEERIRALESAFDCLPETYREVIALSRIARLSRAQVAVQMGRTEAAVKNLLHRALLALAEKLSHGATDGDFGGQSKP